MIFPALLRKYISNLQSQADVSSPTTSTMEAILEHDDERILTLLYKQVQQTGIGKLDYTDAQFKVAVLQMKAATDYSDDGDNDNVDKNTRIDAIVSSYVTLSTDDRINLCEKSLENITSCHDLREAILPSTHARVREANHLMEKAKDLLYRLKCFRKLEHFFLKGHHAPAA